MYNSFVSNPDLVVFLPDISAAGGPSARLPITFHFQYFVGNVSITLKSNKCESRMLHGECRKTPLINPVFIAYDVGKGFDVGLYNRGIITVIRNS